MEVFSDPRVNGQLATQVYCSPDALHNYEQWVTYPLRMLYEDVMGTNVSSVMRAYSDGLLGQEAFPLRTFDIIVVAEGEDVDEQGFFVAVDPFAANWLDLVQAKIRQVTGMARVQLFDGKGEKVGPNDISRLVLRHNDVFVVRPSTDSNETIELQIGSRINSSMSEHDQMTVYAKKLAKRIYKTNDAKKLQRFADKKAAYELAVAVARELGLDAVLQQRFNSNKQEFYGRVASLININVRAALDILPKNKAHANTLRKSFVKDFDRMQFAAWIGNPISMLTGTSDSETETDSGSDSQGEATIDCEYQSYSDFSDEEDIGAPLFGKRSRFVTFKLERRAQETPPQEFGWTGRTALEPGDIIHTVVHAAPKQKKGAKPPTSVVIDIEMKSRLDKTARWVTVNTVELRLPTTGKAPGTAFVVPLDDALFRAVVRLRRPGVGWQMMDVESTHEFTVDPQGVKTSKKRNYPITWEQVRTWRRDYALRKRNNVPEFVFHARLINVEPYPRAEGPGGSLIDYYPPDKPQIMDDERARTLDEQDKKGYAEFVKSYNDGVMYKATIINDVRQVIWAVSSGRKYEPEALRDAMQWDNEYESAPVSERYLDWGDAEFEDDLIGAEMVYVHATPGVTVNVTPINKSDTLYVVPKDTLENEDEDEGLSEDEQYSPPPPHPKFASRPSVVRNTTTYAASSVPVVDETSSRDDQDEGDWFGGGEDFSLPADGQQSFSSRKPANAEPLSTEEEPVDWGMSSGLGDWGDTSSAGVLGVSTKIGVTYVKIPPARPRPGEPSEASAVRFATLTSDPGTAPLARPAGTRRAQVKPLKRPTATRVVVPVTTGTSSQTGRGRPFTRLPPGTRSPSSSLSPSPPLLSPTGSPQRSDEEDEQLIDVPSPTPPGDVFEDEDLDPRTNDPIRLSFLNSTSNSAVIIPMLLHRTSALPFTTEQGEELEELLSTIERYRQVLPETGVETDIFYSNLRRQIDEAMVKVARIVHEMLQENWGRIQADVLEAQGPISDPFAGQEIRDVEQKVISPLNDNPNVITYDMVNTLIQFSGQANRLAEIDYPKEPPPSRDAATSGTSDEPSPPRPPSPPRLADPLEVRRLVNQAETNAKYIESIGRLFNGDRYVPLARYFDNAVIDGIYAAYKPAMDAVAELKNTPEPTQDFFEEVQTLAERDVNDASKKLNGYVRAAIQQLFTQVEERANAFLSRARNSPKKSNAENTLRTSIRVKSETLASPRIQPTGLTRFITQYEALLASFDRLNKNFSSGLRKQASASEPNQPVVTEEESTAASSSTESARPEAEQQVASSIDALFSQMEAQQAGLVDDSVAYVTMTGKAIKHIFDAILYKAISPVLNPNYFGGVFKKNKRYIIVLPDAAHWAVIAKGFRKNSNDYLDYLTDHSFEVPEGTLFAHSRAVKLTSLTGKHTIKVNRNHDARQNVTFIKVRVGSESYTGRLDTNIFTDEHRVQSIKLQDWNDF